jgi:hypothetical protein
MLTFETIPLDREIGRRDLLLEPGIVARWRELFPDDDTGTLMPPGMIAVVTIKTYSDILVPRPPGNVHGEQRFEMIRLPRVGEHLVTRLSCVSKERKGERRWVRFLTETTDAAGDACFRGLMTVLWAA